MARVPPRLWPELELYVRLSGHFENLFCKTRRLFCKTFRSREQKDYKKQRCGRGGTGRRKGLKIPRWQRRVGSSPTARTKFMASQGSVTGLRSCGSADRGD